MWSTSTDSGARLVMQDDCNLVLYKQDADDPAAWASDTSCELVTPTDTPMLLSLPKSVRFDASGNGVDTGRIEVQQNGVWGTVCDDDFTNSGAMVACRAIGFADGGVVATHATWGTPYATSPINMDNAACTGSESSLDECPGAIIVGSEGFGGCTHSEDVAVCCGSAYVTDGASCTRTYAWTESTGTGCAGRNELPSQSGITIEAAKVYCESEPTCVSFEQKTTSTSGKFQFSTSCLPSLTNSDPNWSLFVIDRSRGTSTAASSLKVDTQQVQDQAIGNVVTTATSAPKISLLAGVLMALCLVAAVSLVAVLRRVRVSGFEMEGVRSMVGYGNSGSSLQLHTWNTRNPVGRVESTPAAEGGCLMAGAAVGQGSDGGGSIILSRTQMTGLKWGWGAEAGPVEEPIVQQAVMAVL
jgi:hypothetical protein